MKEEAADNRSVSEKFADCLILGDSVTQGLYEYGVLMRRMYRQTAERKFRKSAVKD